MLTKQVRELTNATFQESSGESDRPVLVDFWALWCPRCRALVPEIAEHFDGRAEAAGATL